MEEKLRKTLPSQATRSSWFLVFFNPKAPFRLTMRLIILTSSMNFLTAPLSMSSANITWSVGRGFIPPEICSNIYPAFSEFLVFTTCLFSQQFIIFLLMVLIRW